MKKIRLLIPILLVMILFIFTGCAEQIDIIESTADRTYGFFGGLWHGFIAPFSFFGSLLSDNIAMYAVNNNGGWYDLGFVLGAGILFGGGGASSR